MIARDMRGVYVSYMSCVVKMFICTICTSSDALDHLDQLLGTDSVAHSSYPVHVGRSPHKHISFIINPSSLSDPFDISKPLNTPAAGGF